MVCLLYLRLYLNLIYNEMAVWRIAHLTTHFILVHDGYFD